MAMAEGAQSKALIIRMPDEMLAFCSAQSQHFIHTAVDTLSGALDTTKSF